MVSWSGACSVTIKIEMCGMWLCSNGAGGGGVAVDDVVGIDGVEAADEVDVAVDDGSFVVVVALLPQYWG